MRLATEDFPKERLLVDHNGRIMDCTTRAARLLSGCNRSELIGTSIMDTTPARKQPDLVKTIRCCVTESLKTNHCSAEKDWILTTAGWQYYHWDCEAYREGFALLTWTDLTKTCPNNEWLARINVEKKRLDLTPYVPGESMSGRDLKILQLELANIDQKVIADQLNVSLRTVENTMTIIRKKFRPLSNQLGVPFGTTIFAIGLLDFIKQDHTWFP